MDRELNIQRIFIYQNVSKKEFEKFSKKLENMTDIQIAEFADECQKTFYSSGDASSSYDYDYDDEHDWDFSSDHRDEDFGDIIPEEDDIEGF